MNNELQNINLWYTFDMFEDKFRRNRNIQNVVDPRCFIQC